MNVLIVGAGKGSWQMRGVQLGAALGARVTSAPMAEDWRWADVAVLLKKHAAAWAGPAHLAGVPIVWDALDFWRQPADHGYTQAQALALLQSHLALLKPSLTIGATQAMASAAGGVYLRHHCWAGLQATPPRREVTIVGYDGNELYLGRWHQWLTTACRRRGWQFITGPESVRAADILVALRDGIWDGWMCREWKSGVKIGNAIAAGRPVVTQYTAAVRELHPVGATCETFEELDAALDGCAQTDTREAAYAAATVRGTDFTVEAVAAEYRSMLLKTWETRCVA